MRCLTTNTDIVITKKTRNDIGALNIATSQFNDSVIELHKLENEMIFQDKPHNRQMKASVGHYNAQLTRITENSKEIYEAIILQQSKNWFIRLFGSRLWPTHD